MQSANALLAITRVVASCTIVLLIVALVDTVMGFVMPPDKNRINQKR